MSGAIYVRQTGACRSKPSKEDTKFQYCTIKHRAASKCVCMRSKHILSSRWRSSFVLKMNRRLQKRLKCYKKRTVMNVYLVQTFSNGKVSFAMTDIECE